MDKKDYTKHYNNQRYIRENFIEEYLGGDGYIVDGFVVDKFHPMGEEVHSITENGVIIIHNLKTGKLITKLLARPQQIMRYYESTGREPPPDYDKILELARWHESLGYNNI